MREILFRGKRLDNGEWVEGNLFAPDEVKHRKAPTEILVGTNIVRISWEVDPATVGQYTGLKDKNGRRIFEGDILKDEWGKIYKVIFTPYSCSFMVECTVAPHEYETGRYRIGVAWCDTIEVIGNIHDNPEMLEVR